MVVILSILVVGLGGYIVYDKIIKTDNNNIIDNNQNIGENTSFYEDILNNIENKLISFNPKQDKINYGKINFEYTCIEENEHRDCLDGNLNINNQTYYVSPTAYIYYNTEHLIIKDDGGDGYYGDFKVIDFTGKEIISKEHIGTICTNEGMCDYFGIKGNEEKIYYIERKNDKLYLNYINLNSNFNIELVSELKNYHVAG